MPCSHLSPLIRHGLMDLRQLFLFWVGKSKMKRHSAVLEFDRTTLLETGMLVVAAPLLLFPTVSPLATALVLVVTVLWWLARWQWEGQFLPVTPFNGALLLWALMVCIGTLLSPYPDLTLPKTSNLLLGLMSWRYLVLTGTTTRRIRWAVIALVLIGVGMIGVGMLSIQWSSTKIPFLQPLLARLPERLIALPEGPDAGINANQLAGVLAFYLPLMLSLGWALFQRRPLPLIPTLLSALAWLLMGVLLLATQSRSGWIGALVGLMAWGCLEGLASRRLGLVATVLGLILLLVVGALAFIGPEALMVSWTTGNALQTEAGMLSLTARVEIWSRALYAIQDFPLTGCGLGAFRRVMWILYPLFTVPANTDLAHAHNIFLQVAVDTGLPGLIAYLAMLGLGCHWAWRVARQAPQWRWLLLGLLASGVALHVYGLTDALAPGSKPGLAVWWGLGLVSAVATLCWEQNDD